jgi:hypothetical protein
MNDKYTESDIHIKSKFVEKLDNFWFYYKIHVIVAVFLIFVFSVCFVQSCSKEESDITVLYSGPYLYSATELEGVRNELNTAMPSDFDGNGKKYTDIVTYQVMSEEQLVEFEALLKGEDEKSNVDRTYFTTQLQTYNNYVMTGECGVFLLDRHLYDKLVSLDSQHIILRPLSEIFAEIPENAVGEYGINFSKTQLYTSSHELSKLPEDTVLCLSQPFVMGKSGNAKYYTRMTQMFVAMAK